MHSEVVTAAQLILYEGPEWLVKPIGIPSDREGLLAINAEFSVLSDTIMGWGPYNKIIVSEQTFFLARVLSRKDYCRELAAELYSKVYGSIDDKYFEPDKTYEMYQWLADGDLEDVPSLDDLADEWREYDAHDVAVRLGIETPAATWSEQELRDRAVDTYKDAHFRVSDAKAAGMSREEYVNYLLDEATTDHEKRGLLKDPYDPAQIETVRTITDPDYLNTIERVLESYVDDDWE